ncbi:MAG: ribosome biogenesis GTPase YlqF [Bacillota bacterium]|jgi:ribosome biogenesis GTPase A
MADSEITNINWYPGHMVKGKRNIAADLRRIDVLIEVLDARAPKSSRNPDLSNINGQKKPHVLVLNKADLADAEATKKWLAFYRRRGYQAVAVNAVQKRGIKELLAAVNRAAEPLLQKLADKGRLSRPVRAMVVGIPNSGKSTVINAFCPAKTVKTGNMPGVTRGQQWVKTTAGIELLDTPGVLWPRFADYRTAFNLAVIGSISDLVYPYEKIAQELAELLLEKNPQALQDRFKLSELPVDGRQLITAIGKRRGLLAAGGRVRMEDSSLLLLREFRAGLLGRYTLDDKRDDKKDDQHIND